ncbi:MAG: hypothetical protein IPN72_04130 [Saprospiraceae bacterium]|nr:hypothetical protein [Saprospiraceae bacterium]
MMFFIVLFSTVFNSLDLSNHLDKNETGQTFATVFAPDHTGSVPFLKEESNNISLLNMNLILHPLLENTLHSITKAVYFL